MDTISGGDIEMSVRVDRNGEVAENADGFARVVLRWQKFEAELPAGIARFGERRELDPGAQREIPDLEAAGMALQVPLRHLLLVPVEGDDAEGRVRVDTGKMGPGRGAGLDAPRLDVASNGHG